MSRHGSIHEAGPVECGRESDREISSGRLIGVVEPIGGAEDVAAAAAHSEGACGVAEAARRSRSSDIEIGKLGARRLNRKRG